MNVPVVLPNLRATVAADGTVSITVDDEPYAPTDVPTGVSGRRITRGDLRQVINEIASERQCAVRVEVAESDGTTYSDIATPPEGDTAPGREASREEPADLAPRLAARLSAELTVGLPGLIGTGFGPGEQVAVAYVLMHGTADDAGAASVHLPAASLTNRTPPLVLFGLESKRIATIDGGAATP